MKLAATASATPALVLGEPSATTLAVIRALGRKGIPQFVVGAAESFVSRSRWYRPAAGATQPQRSPEWLRRYLARVPVERMAVVPCSDAWVAALVQVHGELAARFPASVPPAEVIDILLDKARFAEAMVRHGIPHPRTTPVGTIEDLARLPDAAFRDGFLKPRQSWRFGPRFGVKGFRCATRADALDRVRVAREAGLELVLQELIPGPPTAHYFLEGFMDRVGTMSVCIASQRLRMFPPELADGCFGVSIPSATVAEAHESLSRLLRTLRYRGVFAAEFKYDARDSQFKIIEINPRVWAYVGFATACGADVVEMAYRDALELPVTEVPAYRIGCCYLDPYVDLRAGWSLIRSGQLTLSSWLRSWRGATQTVICRDDPRPAVAHAFALATHLARKRLNRHKG